MCRTDEGRKPQGVWFRTRGKDAAQHISKRKWMKGKPLLNYLSRNRNNLGFSLPDTSNHHLSTVKVQDSAFSIPTVLNIMSPPHGHDMDYDDQVGVERVDFVYMACNITFVRQ